MLGDVSNMNELISIVIITYKRPITVLKRAIDSARFQDYKNLEIIIVNDCPEDSEGSLAIDKLVASYDDSRIILKHHQKNKGANAARNTGLNIAKGSFIAFLDDDDEWYKNKISSQYNAICKSERYGIAYSGFLRIEDKNEIPCYPKCLKKNDSCLENILEDNYIGPTSFSLIRMKAIKMVGGFDEKIKVCQEYELWIRILEKYDAICVNELLGNYYYSEDSTFKNVDKYLNGCNVLINKHDNVYKNYPRALSNKLINMFIYACKKHKWGEALKYKKRAFEACPTNVNNFTLFVALKKLLK